jgi:hypothetical protein
MEGRRVGGSDASYLGFLGFWRGSRARGKAVLECRQGLEGELLDLLDLFSGLTFFLNVEFEVVYVCAAGEGRCGCFECGGGRLEEAKNCDYSFCFLRSLALRLVSFLSFWSSGPVEARTGCGNPKRNVRWWMAEWEKRNV